MLKRLLARLGAEPQARALIAAGEKAEREGRLAEACERYRRALAIAPRLAAAHLNLGAALEASADLEGARRAYRAVLELEPQNPYASYNLGNLAAASADWAGAERLLRKALEHKPQFPEAQVALSNVLDATGRRGAALEALRAALAQRPAYPGAWFNCGLVLRALERLDEAEDALRRAIALDPDYTDAYRELGALLRSGGRAEEALQCYGNAPAAVRESPGIESASLLTALHVESVSDDELFLRHRAFAERLAKAHASHRQVRATPDDPQRRLRVGYVSADFCLHPVAAQMIPVLAHHDRSAFEVHCYMTGDKVDHVTGEMRGLAGHWHEAAALGDAALADAVRRDRIDLLVDLMGHAAVNTRLGVFARQPAPVQLSWVGYLHSTALDAIRYRITDRHCDPPGDLAEARHTETLVRLPASQWCYRPLFASEHAVSPPCVRNGFVTFGSFNHPAKLSPTLRRLWHEILCRVPQSRLLVVGVPAGRATEALHRDLAGGAVDPARISVMPRVALNDYFPLFDRVDIALDSWPYSGGTTTLDTLWMGVPVLTAPGSRSVSRSSTSILRTLGLQDWVAGDPGGYVALAAAKAGDRTALAGLRAALRGRMRGSPLMDEAGFTRALEDAYRQMWREWCQNRA